MGQLACLENDFSLRKKLSYIKKLAFKAPTSSSSHQSEDRLDYKNP